MPAAKPALYAATAIAALHQFGDRTAVRADKIVQSVPKYLALMGLAAGQNARNWQPRIIPRIGMTFQDAPVKGMTFREGRAVPE
jgi:hypothetical protein